MTTRIARDVDDYTAFPGAQRKAVVHAQPRREGFKECFICAFTDGLRHRPQTTFGAVKANVLKDPMASVTPINVVDVICCSPWAR